MPNIKLMTFGGVRVWLDERDITAELPTKLIALLIYVARHGKPKPREHLANLFWGDKSAKQAYGSLRTAISKAKSLLGEALQVTHNEIGVSAWLDANQFEVLVANPLQREEGLKLYRGDFMVSFFADDAREFDDWQVREAEKLHEQFIQASLNQIQDLQKGKQVAEAILVARHALSLAPLREDMQRTLIQLYHQAGDRASALRQYQHYRNILWEELGVEPDDETQAVYHQIEQTRVFSPPIHYRLPPRLTSYIGQANAVQTVSMLIRDNPLVTITAMGGVGKTRLALEVAHRLQESFRHGVCFVDLSDITDADHVLPIIAKTLGLPDDSDMLAQITTYLTHHDLLLILDNFEHVIDATPIIEHWLDRVSQLKLIITSREPLKLYGEYIFQLQMLSLHDSCQLFYDRVRAIHADFVRTDTIDSQVKTICGRLDGVPLAIELAASRTRTMSISEIEAGLNKCLSLLQSDLRNMPRRQRTLFSTIEWSYNQLTDEQATLFRHLAVFRGGWVREAVEFISLYAHELDALIDKNLIRRTAFGTHRFMMLETIREYAYLQLETKGELASAQNQHARWVHSFAQNSVTALRSSHQAHIIRQIHEEEQNIRVALDYFATQPDKIGLYAETLSALGWTWNFLQIATLPFHHAKQILAHADRLSPSQHAHLLIAGGHSAHALAQYDLAQQWHEQAYDIFVQLGDVVNADYARLFMSSRITNESEAVIILSDLRKIAQTRHDDFLLSIVNLNLGIGYLYLGKFDQSKIILADGLQICERNGYTIMMPIYYINSANACSLSGDFEQAFTLFEQAIALSQASGNGFNQAYAILDLCELCFIRGYWDELDSNLKQAEQLVKELQLPVLWVLFHFWDAVLASINQNLPRFYNAYQHVLHNLNHHDVNMRHYIVNSVLYLATWLSARDELLDWCAILLGGIDAFVDRQHITYTNYQIMWRNEVMNALDEDHLEKHKEGKSQTIQTTLEHARQLLDQFVALGGANHAPHV